MMSYMDHPSFSIIIPHYNIPDLLMRCLDSIPVQEDIQVIVVDDCSPGAEQYVQKYPALSRPYLEFYHTPIGGSAGRARNVGLDHARGKWLIFIDADDFFTNNMEAVLEESKDRTEDILFYNYKVVKNSDLTTPGVRNWYSKYFEQYAIDKDESRFRYRYDSLVGKLFYRPFVQKHQIRFDETSHANDVAFSFKCGYYAQNIAIINKTFFIVTEREGSLASSQFTHVKPSSKEFKARLRVSLTTSAFINQHNIPVELDYKEYALSFFKIRPLAFMQYLFFYIIPEYPKYAIRIINHTNLYLVRSIRKRLGGKMLR